MASATAARENFLVQAYLDKENDFDIIEVFNFRTTDPEQVEQVKQWIETYHKGNKNFHCDIRCNGYRVFHIG